MSVCISIGLLVRHTSVPVIGIIAGTLAGVGLGIISGLFPGIHSNTLAAMLLGLQAFLIPVGGAEALAATMFAALITHTFLDSIPSTPGDTGPRYGTFSTSLAHALS